MQFSFSPGQTRHDSLARGYPARKRMGLARSRVAVSSLRAIINFDFFIDFSSIAVRSFKLSRARWWYIAVSK